LATEDGGKLRVWSIETGQEFFQAKISVNSRISSFAFSGINGDILVANVDRQLLRIPWQTKELTAQACHRFARSMEEDEWLRFFDQEPYQKTCD
jgi:WD40 repeat protein